VSCITPDSTARAILADDLGRRDTDAGGSARRSPTRPLDDGTTESIRVIEFVWRAGSRIQPVLWLDRELLN
jgi:hypothetical protein